MYTLGALARLVEGEVVGDPELEIRRARPFEEAGEGDITYAADARYLSRLEATRASAVIVRERSPGCDHLLITRHPKLAFAKILKELVSRPFVSAGVSPQASVGVDCQIAEDVSVGPFVSIGDRVHVGSEVTIGAGSVVGSDCEVGSGSTLHPNVTLYPGVKVGRRVILHSGCIVGADGFGFVEGSEGHFKIEQVGTVVIEDDVEIGANSTVDRATFGATIIGKGCKLDNLVHVGHNCRIGPHTVIVGCVGISGSVTIGSHCLLLGQAGVSQHLEIGDHVTIMQKTAVTRNIPSKSVVSGLHARNHIQQLRTEAMLGRLPQLYRQMQRLVAELSETHERDAPQERDDSV